MDREGNGDALAGFEDSVAGVVLRDDLEWFRRFSIDTADEEDDGKESSAELENGGRVKERECGKEEDQTDSKVVDFIRDHLR